ncbi:GNAT family N-acetyltransferase [Streptomyces sp. SID11385]|uniref:GNAT family N-acetyltransferase n=1 Tax=Streptomyces sp. SID11385 TaxID=2706031 RepID=UPI0013CAF4A9|nr:GNAT family N-acetyltransferase [Streptomyces sp. SID11385]NEA38429.1 hypothetical protein [Streptomyces sp. SID11385]
MDSELSAVVFAERPDLHEASRSVLHQVWPEFIFHDAASERYVPLVERYFPEFDLLLVEGEAEGGGAGQGVGAGSDGGNVRVVAGGWGVPVRWDGSYEDLPAGYDGALERSVAQYGSGVAPDTLVVMAAAVDPALRARGLAGALLTALREKAIAAGLSRVVVPVRPTLKARYPLTSMAEFARWTRDDGLHLDPWVRTHQRLGASVLGVAEDSMIIGGTVAEWEKWTGMALPGSGSYVVPGALDVLRVDREADRAVYREANLWMRHV